MVLDKQSQPDYCMTSPTTLTKLWKDSLQQSCSSTSIHSQKYFFFLTYIISNVCSWSNTGSNIDVNKPTIFFLLLIIE